MTNEQRAKAARELEEDGEPCLHSTWLGPLDRPGFHPLLADYSDDSETGVPSYKPYVNSPEFAEAATAEAQRWMDSEKIDAVGACAFFASEWVVTRGEARPGCIRTVDEVQA